MKTTYKMITPYGDIDFSWKGEGSAVSYACRGKALRYFDDYLSITLLNRADGSRITIENIESIDMMSWVMPNNFGIVVIPNLDDLFSTDRLDRSA
jgi:hypothetical protein